MLRRDQFCREVVTPVLINTVPYSLVLAGDKVYFSTASFFLKFFLCNTTTLGKTSSLFRLKSHTSLSLLRLQSYFSISNQSSIKKILNRKSRILCADLYKNRLSRRRSKERTFYPYRIMDLALLYQNDLWMHVFSTKMTFLKPHDIRKIPMQNHPVSKYEKKLVGICKKNSENTKNGVVTKLESDRNLTFFSPFPFLKSDFRVYEIFAEYYGVVSTYRVKPRNSRLVSYRDLYRTTGTRLDSTALPYVVFQCSIY